MTQILDGFWLPKNIRQQILTPDIDWITLKYTQGHPTESNGPGIVSARWPKLSFAQWENLLKALREARTSPPKDFFIRLNRALQHLAGRFNNPSDPLNQIALEALPAYTGYSGEMIHFVLGALDLMPVDILEKIIQLQLPDSVRSQYIRLKEISDLDGRIRLYASKSKNPIQRWLAKPGADSLKSQPAKPEMVLGYAAGNVIGTSHLISLLGQISALVGVDKKNGNSRFPAILIKNSRQEPIFTPLIFSAIEDFDSELVSSMAIMIWDYEDLELQDTLVSQADLVIAAAADFTIEQIDAVIQKVQRPDHPIRFHQHGHKISFTALALPYLKKKSIFSIPGNPDRIDVVTLLSAVDSIFWDQYGCLSSRIHFVEQGSSEHYSPREYGNILAEKIRLLSKFLPRGAIPLHGIHNRFEKYAALMSSGKAHLCSTYDDDFLVVVDERPWSPPIFHDVINDCIERSVVIRPVKDIQEIPDRYLSWLPPKNLQTMSVAIDGPENQTWSPRFNRFVESIGQRGVTGIRTIGRGPFPQLAYSWDGYLPIDTAIQRPSGWFTTVEFENTAQQIIETYALFLARGAI
jgi:hypothetical protein